MTMKFRIRIEADSPHYDDAAEIARTRHLNGTEFEAADLHEATAKLRDLGLDCGHGVGIQTAQWAYPCTGDKGFKVWFLTGLHTRRRLGNACKVQQLRTPR